MRPALEVSPASAETAVMMASAPETPWARAPVMISRGDLGRTELAQPVCRNFDVAENLARLCSSRLDSEVL